MNIKLESGLSPRTVQYHHAILRSAFGQAVKWGTIFRNVAKLVDSPRVDRKEVEPLAMDEVPRLLEAARGERLSAVYVLALATGMRQGEIPGLRWDDLDLNEGSLRVRFTLQRIDGKFQLVEPKSRSSRRSFDLPQTAVTVLRKHRVPQLEERLPAGQKWEDWNLVFPTQRGMPMEASNLIRSFHRLLAKARIRRTNFHNIRHTATSLWGAQGVHPRVIMELLGHSQFGLTMNTYAHIMPPLRREAAERVDLFLAGLARGT